MLSVVPARILVPGQFLAEPGARNHIGIAVTIYIQRKIAQIIDVSLDERYLAHAMLLPVRRFVPILASDDIEPSILIHIGDRRGLVGALVDQVLTKHGPVRLVLRVGGQKQNGNKKQKRRNLHQFSVSSRAISKKTF